MPSSVTTLEENCFANCHSLTSVSIPNSVTTLGMACFDNCYNLISVSIPNSVTRIDEQCFYDCDYLYDVTCNWTDPKSYTLDIFDSQALSKATLHVPAGTKSKYTALDPWSSFNTIVENSSPSNPTPSCDAPTISYKDGKLDFSCTTTGASYHYTISSPDVTSSSEYTTGEVELAATDIIKVFATADGYTTSPTTTATIYWLNNENTSNGIAKTSTRGVMVSTDGGIITIKGLTDGESVSFYTVSGTLIGSAKAANGTVTYSTNTPDQVVIAKIGTQSIKVAL
jgi:hypothetical protein